jgi:hypothetical protein
MNNPHLPPAYVNIPVPVAYARDVDDAVLVTMIRILGLCWNRSCTPSLTRDELAEAVGRSRSALYRHLRILKDDDEGGKNPGCLRWIRIEQTGWHVVICPLVKAAGRAQPVRDLDGGAPPARARDDSLAGGELQQALQEIGVQNPKRDQLARRDLDPTWVYAWDLWARHPQRQSLTNPVGNVIVKLESGARPPDEFLREAARRLRDRRHPHREHPADGNHPPSEPEPEARPVPPEADRLWASVLDDLLLQMDPATFNAWLRGSRVLATEGDRLTIGVRNAYAVEWLEKRLMRVIKRTLAWHAGADTGIAFTPKP